MNHSLLYQKVYPTYLAVADLVTYFPKKDRYSIGIRLETELLELLKQAITAEVALPSLKDRALVYVITQAEISKVLIRGALDRTCIKETSYFSLAEKLEEIAKMANGWRKSLNH